MGLNVFLLLQEEENKTKTSVCCQMMLLFSPVCFALLVQIQKQVTLSDSRLLGKHWQTNFAGVWRQRIQTSSKGLGSYKLIGLGEEFCSPTFQFQPKFMLDENNSTIFRHNQFASIFQPHPKIQIYIFFFSFFSFNLYLI